MTALFAIVAVALVAGIALILSAERQLRLANYAIVHRHGNAGLYLVLGSLVVGGLGVVL